MKTLLLLIVLNAPVATLAQRPAGSLATETSTTGDVGSFSLRYREGYHLARSASLYRTLRDARLGHAAHKLHAGAKV